MDSVHYAPPWNYNPECRKKGISKDTAKEELLEVIKSTKPDKSTPRITEDRGDYLHVEYESLIFGLVDDVEFWFLPGKDSVLEYRSASRTGNFDFDANQKRIKALRGSKSTPSNQRTRILAPNANSSRIKLRFNDSIARVEHPSG